MPTLLSRNPYTEEINATFETLTKAEVLEKIEQAHIAYLSWKNVQNSEKKRLFHLLADELENDIEACAKLETIEMGMLNHVSRA